MEADFVYSWHETVLNWGKGYYLKAYTDLKDLRVKAAWWTNNYYVPLLANPFFNTISVDEPGTMFDSTGMFCVGLEYARRLGAGITLGADADFYLHKQHRRAALGEDWSIRPMSYSFSAGAYLRVNPSILIKQFKKE